MAVLKMFKRGKGVRQLQEQLTRMGYAINDQPAIFGATTRDAVKDIQKRKGLKVTGIVDDELQNLIRESIGLRVDEKSPRNISAKSESSTAADTNQLQALTALLINKGLITQQELDEAMHGESDNSGSKQDEKQPVRITQKPLF